jgi:putative NADH-flavin reductase
MKVVLFGATGRAGSRIMRELLSRGHQVIAVVRDGSTLQPEAGVTTVVDSLSETEKTAAAIAGADAVITAYAPPPDNTDALVAVTQLLVDAVAQSGVPRLLMVGGAGGLEVAPGVTLIDSGYLPTEWLPIAKSHGKALQVLEASAIDWTYLAPAAYFDPGERTGKFRLGTNNLIADASGQSRISMEDYAIAMVDELETAEHPRMRFSVGY